MSHAEVCPVCRGSGKLKPPSHPDYIVVPTPQTCHGCGGSGWVRIE
jgi:DnaJ-class molecular chaperone